MKVFCLHAHLAAGVVCAISDRTYGGIDLDATASGARAIEQTTVKRQLRAGADVETEERGGSPAEMAKTALIVPDKWHLLESANDNSATRSALESLDENDHDLLSKYVMEQVSGENPDYMQEMKLSDKKQELKNAIADLSEVIPEDSAMELIRSAALHRFTKSVSDPKNGDPLNTQDYAQQILDLESATEIIKDGIQRKVAKMAVAQRKFARNFNFASR
uniref:Uncharacterized protein n=1 Tax=Peronospora matthiolae TaxID=2874970 RepID=A0AAV1TF27_9STRA